MRPKRKKWRQLGRGLLYDQATRTAKLSVYVKGRKGRKRLRSTLYDISAEEAEKAIAALRAKENRGSSKPTAVAPTVRAFYEAYFDLIPEGVSASTADGYRTVINRYVLPRFGEMRLSEITAGGVVNVWLREVKKARREVGVAAVTGLPLLWAGECSTLQPSPKKQVPNRIFLSV